jgi:hypothetical protein
MKLDTIVFPEGFEVARFQAFVDEFQLNLVREEIPDDPDMEAEAVWRTPAGDAMFHLFWQAELSVVRLIIRGHAILPWQVALGSRYLQLQYQDAVNAVQTDAPTPQLAGRIMRLSSHRDFDEAGREALVARAKEPNPAPLRRVALLALGQRGREEVPALAALAEVEGDPELSAMIQNMVAYWTLHQ